MKENRHMVEQLWTMLKDESTQCKERMMVQQNNVPSGRPFNGYEMRVVGSVWILLSQRVIRGGIREDTSFTKKYIHGTTGHSKGATVMTFSIKSWTHFLTKSERENFERARQEIICSSPPSCHQIQPALMAKLVAKEDNSAFKMLNTTSGVTSLDFCVMTG
ncbi:hypothetical protein TNCV_5024691 [Trichonephila clavipes]|nr:hypothetical protein TNCV_5024691 [Trichonephila clavipes]